MAKKKELERLEEGEGSIRSSSLSTANVSFARSHVARLQMRQGVINKGFSVGSAIIEQTSSLEHVPSCWPDSAESLGDSAVPPPCFGGAPVPALPPAGIANLGCCSSSPQDASPC